jgi:hypothetical protein
VLRRLDAFDRGARPDGGPVSFETLERAAVADRPAEAIRVALAGEVDAAQAEMFARRHAGVAALLTALSGDDPAARVLRVGLWRRLHDVLGGPPPRALRVRAVIDFYYSMAALRRHRAPGGPGLAARVAGLHWSRVAEGVEHALLDGHTDEGPLHVNLLAVAPGCRISARDARGTGDFAAWVAEQGACAGTSGGFFLYSEPDIRPPSARHDLVGLLVEDGRVRSPATLGRSCLVQEADGRFAVRRISPTAQRVHLGDGRSLHIVGRNTPPPRDGGATAWDRAHGHRAPALPGPWIAVVGQQARWLPPGPADIPLNGLLLALPAGTHPAPGPIRWTTADPLPTAIAGGPRLLHGGAPDLDRPADDLRGDAPPITFSQDETWDQNLLPRMAAGVRRDGTLILAAIDGRNLDRAPGFTLAGTAALLRHLGCAEAVNLDGGSSKRMAVDGRTLDLSTTEVVVGQAKPARVRPVHSAVLVFPRGR